MSMMKALKSQPSCDKGAVARAFVLIHVGVLQCDHFQCFGLDLCMDLPRPV